MTNDWEDVMDAATVVANANGLTFSELRNAWGAYIIERDYYTYEGHGVTASDMNHMLYSAMKSDLHEVTLLAAKLGDENAERNRIIAEIAYATDQHPDLVLQQLRELFAPVVEA